MASGIFAVLDDIAVLMDDVAVASKVAARQTAGILGDDLAVNAEKATGFVSSRELPVLWAITKGSFINKLIIVPTVMLLNVVSPMAIQWILIAGGAYLAYEGIEKIIHYLFHRKQTNVEEKSSDTNEKTKISEAIKTDFILSIEIVIIALGSVSHQSLGVTILTISFIALLATVGVYGLVALIVRMDDVGYRLIAFSKGKGLLNQLGISLIKLLPYIIKMFSVVGTIALILVAGGIFHHQLAFLHHFLPTISTILVDALLGTVGGLLVFSVLGLSKFILKFIR